MKIDINENTKPKDRKIVGYRGERTGSVYLPSRNGQVVRFQPLTGELTVFDSMALFFDYEPVYEGDLTITISL